MRNLAYISLSGVFALIAYTAIRHDSADRTVNIPPAQSEEGEAVQEVAFSVDTEYPQANLAPEAQNHLPRLANGSAANRTNSLRQSIKNDRVVSSGSQSVAQRSPTILSVPSPPSISIRQQMLASSRGSQRGISDGKTDSLSTPLLSAPPLPVDVSAVPNNVAPNMVAADAASIAELPRPSFSNGLDTSSSVNTEAAALTDIASTIPTPWSGDSVNKVTVEPTMPASTLQPSGGSEYSGEGHLNGNPDQALPRFSESSLLPNSIQSQIAPSAAPN